ncbi:unnamed protein product [Mycena citricolor]|uniref:Ubiquitin-like protease family profile domain-containing protein n=1 Tax=Mycena citricolor TaxID=2018698 RepID=A0AAD2K784_9AGAR|nr:unnamed protein product [Mycena citricolor]
MNVGMGITDAEGMERIWSRTRKLIPITRNMGASRRIWMIDQYVGFVNEDGLIELGAWQERQSTVNLFKKASAARAALVLGSISETDLRKHWEDQKNAQTSVRSAPPNRLRRDLEKVITLQGQIDSVDEAILDAKKAILASNHSQKSRRVLSDLQATHSTLDAQVNRLYGSLDLNEDFPNLAHLPIEFLHTLLLMLNGKREALGNRLYQNIKQSISRRQPALLKLIYRFNGYVIKLSECRPADCSIPIPRPLSTKLAELRSDPGLYDDVWISTRLERPPKWLTDENVRDGIQNMLVLDRCREEVKRMALEQSNMRSWISHELNLLRKALDLPGETLLSVPLLTRKNHLEFVSISWERRLRRSEQPRFSAPVMPPVRPASSASTGPASPFACIPASRQNNSPHFTMDDQPQSFGSLPSRPLMTNPLVGHTTAIVQEESEIAVDEDRDSPPPSEVEDNSDTDNESVGSSDGLNAFVWKVPANLSMDSQFATHLRMHNLSHHFIRVNAARKVVGLHGLRSADLQCDDMDRVLQKTGRLNNFALNGLAKSLFGIFAEPHSPFSNQVLQCALFSTYDLARVQTQASDQDLWRSTAQTIYWRKRLWVVPIHRPSQEHWVLAMHVSFLFAPPLEMTSEPQDLGNMVSRLSALASQNHPEEFTPLKESQWTVLPIYNQVLQTNSHDCGVWVLCAIAATLRGFDAPFLTERDIPEIRSLFFEHFLTLPLLAPEKRVIQIQGGHGGRGGRGGTATM